VEKTYSLAHKLSITDQLNNWHLKLFYSAKAESL